MTTAHISHPLCSPRQTWMLMGRVAILASGARLSGSIVILQLQRVCSQNARREQDAARSLEQLHCAWAQGDFRPEGNLKPAGAEGAGWREELLLLLLLVGIVDAVVDVCTGPRRPV